jgi:hypothetical protein
VTSGLPFATPISAEADATPRAEICKTSNALPTNWQGMWGEAPSRVDLRQIKTLSGQLAEEMGLVNRRGRFGPLVGSNQLRDEPVHRWFSYKEGYSPALLSAVIECLEMGSDSLRVSDVFGGVATTALSGRAHPRVKEVRSLEYSPWAHFAGATKLAWPSLDPGRLRELLPDAVNYSLDEDLPIPRLTSFTNPRIFHNRRVRSLVSAREHLTSLPSTDSLQRNFLLLGLGAIIEDLSYAMKDGRALRIKGNRKRRPSSLLDHPSPAVPAQSGVKRAMVGQWTAMIEDLEQLAEQRQALAETPAVHLLGDARAPAATRMPDGTSAFPDGWSDVSCFSPPYLNCIDYSELYKLELWMMGHIASDEEFRKTRLGTLRSHPSIKFEERHSFSGFEGERVVELVRMTSLWLTENSARRDIGPVVQAYFEDMFEVWRAQVKFLSKSGIAVCVVANSTFSRRDKAADGTIAELWRMPLLTDVLLAHLALLAGFGQVEIWDARNLRPRNVRGGAARESLVVARK